jgi:ABC-type Mn2+/Zn2+ transport system ATPase subunit
MIVDLHNIGVRFGRHEVLRDVAMTLAIGDLVELRGPNGSGKTTLLRVLSGCATPTSGRRRARTRVAYVPANLVAPPLHAGRWLRALYHHRRDVMAALDTLGFAGDLDAPCRELSFGNFRKLALAGALCADVDLVTVDEARTGLDDRGLTGLADLVARRRSDAAVVLADQVSFEPIGSSTVMMIADGRLVERLAAGAGFTPVIDK